jgi:hypothetical protein
MGSPWGSPCARGDLDPHKPKPNGGIDSKVTSWQLAANMSAEVVNGPTSSGTVPPFNWTDFGYVFDNMKGMPPHFDYAFELQEPGPDF